MQNKQTLSKPLVVMLLAGLCCLLWGQRDSVYQSGLSIFRRIRRRHGDADSLRRLPILSGGFSDDSV